MSTSQPTTSKDLSNIVFNSTNSGTSTVNRPAKSFRPKISRSVPKSKFANMVHQFAHKFKCRQTTHDF